METLEHIGRGESATGTHDPAGGVPGRDAIESRTSDPVETATDGGVLVIGDGSLLTDGFVDVLNGVDSAICASTEPL